MSKFRNIGLVVADLMCLFLVCTAIFGTVGVVATLRVNKMHKTLPSFKQLMTVVSGFSLFGFVATTTALYLGLVIDNFCPKDNRKVELIINGIDEGVLVHLANNTIFSKKIMDFLSKNCYSNQDSDDKVIELRATI